MGFNFDRDRHRLRQRLAAESRRQMERDMLAAELMHEIAVDLVIEDQGVVQTLRQIDLQGVNRD